MFKGQLRKDGDEASGTEPVETNVGTVGSGRPHQTGVREVARERLLDAATHDATSVYRAYHTCPTGLTADRVAASRAEYGSNAVRQAKRESNAKRLALSFADPFTGILVVLAIISFLTDVVFATPADRNPATSIIIVVMILISGILRFVQEGKSDAAVDDLLEMVRITCCVERAETGKEEVPLDELVVGDVVHVAAGDLVPADIRLVNVKDLTINEGALTGESVPVLKGADVEDGAGAVTDLKNLAFMGSTVVSGGGMGIVIATGSATMLGEVTNELGGREPKTAFDKGVSSVSWLLIRFMLVMVPLVFVINGLTKGDWLQSGLFALSVAVGLTPEMLPMLVTTCLAKGAVDMSKRKVITRHLDAIENLGSIDVLCCDKTGTLTQNRVILERHLDLDGNDSTEVLVDAYVNSSYQTGLKNLTDVAVIDACKRGAETDERLKDLDARYEKVDEVPFDFERRRMSVLVRDGADKTRLITKGAVEEMLKVCSEARIGGQAVELSDDRRKVVMDEAVRLARQGMRVIAVAELEDPDIGEKLDSEDERGMVLMGYLAFLDPPKESSADAIRSLAAHGVTTKILTGDSERVTRYICQRIGISCQHPILGSDVDGMSDDELARRAEHTTIFAKLSPAQKARIVRILRTSGHAVGYMGDGVNDAAAMQEADCGISVDSAVDIAKESADIILLEKDLDVLDQGIIEGRKTYGNMMKYIKMTASSNFGNIFSVLLASVFLPFLPMAPVQLLLLNLIYDLCCCAIPWDNVDDDYVQSPRAWDASSIARFMMWMGPTSSVFDVLTFALLFFVICPFGCGSSYGDLSSLAAIALFTTMFQAGWFVESMWAQSLVIHLIRTEKIPFRESVASAPVIRATIAAGVIATLIAFTPIGSALGFTAPPLLYFAFLILVITGYILLETAVKRLYIKTYGELL